MRKGVALLLVVLLTVMNIPPPPVVSPIVPVTASPEVAPLAVIKVLDTGLGTSTYMAHFLSDELLMVATHHGDASLDGKYVSSRGNIYIYRYEEGAWKLIKTLTGPGVWRISDWSKVWSNSGYFSGDGKYLLEDLWSGAYGTSARVVELATGTTRPIDFSGLPSTDFYPCQISYDATYIAAGTKSGDVYVWRWNGTYYQRIFTYHIGGDIRRLHMTLDGRYLIVGALGVNTLYIFQRSGETYTILSTVQLNDGVGALGISDPWRIGLIAVGGDSGWIYVINASDPAHPKLIHASKPGSDRFYNPFYDRWMPKNVAVLAFKDTGSVGVIYDIYANATIVLSEQGKATSVSPLGTWAFVGDSIYMVVLRDPQSGKPRVRIHGILQTEVNDYNLGSPLTLAPPADGWHMYIFGGDIMITKLRSLKVPLMLVDDEDFTHGRLGRLWERGFVRLWVLKEEGGYVDRDKSFVMAHEAPEYGWSKEDTIIAHAYHVVKMPWFWIGHGLEGSTIASAVTINVPLTTPVEPYSNITLVPNFEAAITAPIFDPWGEIKGMAMAIIGAGTTLTLAKFGERAALSSLFILQKENLVVTAAQQSLFRSLASAAASAASKAAVAASKVLPWVAAAILLEAAETYVAHWVTYTSVRVFLAAAPVLRDKATGKLYTVVRFYLPSGETAYYDQYKEFMSSLFRQMLNIETTEVVLDTLGSDWSDYQQLIKRGAVPRVNLYELVKFFSQKYGIPMDRLEIRFVSIVIVPMCHGRAALWEWVTQGVQVPITVTIHGLSIQVVAETWEREYTDPQEIANVLGTVTVNGVEYPFRVTSKGAVASFSIPEGADRVVISFGRRSHLYADMTLNMSVVIKKDLALKNGYYEGEFHYNFGNTLLRVTRVEFVDMYHEMVRVERTAIYNYYNDTLDMTSAFAFNSSYADEASPTGYRYSYFTISAKYFDPVDGGTFEPCKRFIVRYYYSSVVPDAGLDLSLSDFEASTLPRFALLALNSTVEQDVAYMISFAVTYRINGVDYVLLRDVLNETAHVPANGTVTKTYPIDKYIDAAIGWMYANGSPASVVIYAKIVNAPFNAIRANDEDRVVYRPPSPFVEEYNETVTLIVHVYDALNGSPIEGATVEASDSTTASALTNASGLSLIHI